MSLAGPVIERKNLQLQLAMQTDGDKEWSREGKYVDNKIITNSYQPLRPAAHSQMPLFRGDMRCHVHVYQERNNFDRGHQDRAEDQRRQFFAWCEKRGVLALEQIKPVAGYIEHTK